MYFRKTGSILVVHTPNKRKEFLYLGRSSGEEKQYADGSHVYPQMTRNLCKACRAFDNDVHMRGQPYFCSIHSAYICDGRRNAVGTPTSPCATTVASTQECMFKMLQLTCNWNEIVTHGC